jgi:hypothetical protein
LFLLLFIHSWKRKKEETREADNRW